MDPFIGEIRTFGFNFAPRGWLLCDGRLLPLQNFTTLFSILGTTYGGNGQSNFAIPDLRGRLPMHWGTGPAGFSTVLGETLGTTSVTLISTQIPQHTHQATIAVGAPAQRSALPTATSFLSSPAGGDAAYQKAPVTANVVFSPKAISVAGGGTSHDNQQPFLAVNFCIAFEGVYPQRS